MIEDDALTSFGSRHADPFAHTHIHIKTQKRGDGRRKKEREKVRQADRLSMCLINTYMECAGMFSKPSSPIWYS